MENKGGIQLKKSKRKILPFLASAVMLIVMLTFFGSTAAAEGVEIPINATTFPNQQFRNFVGKYDFDRSNSFSQNEIEYVKEINAFDSDITNFTGIEYFTELEKFNCERNFQYPISLTELDLSKNLKLKELNCSRNPITKLDLSRNIALERLDCYECNLTELDLSNNTALQYLICYENQLTELDLSRNRALISLLCANNLLTTLDLSGHTELTFLYCDNNQITDININGCTKLDSLICRNNQLTELDISNNVALDRIYCEQNKLATIDVSRNINLTELYCSGNAVTALDVSSNRYLEHLGCRDCQLTALNISYNPALYYLSCENNRITHLDVSNNPELTSFYCAGNSLTELDVHLNKKLDTLSCQSNLLTKLTVSGAEKLANIDCSGNSLTELDFNDTNIYNLNCNNNLLTKLNITGRERLDGVDCSNNRLTELSFNGCSKLREINCSHNELTELIFGEALEDSYVTLDCSFNKLEKLEGLANIKNLYQLFCGDNRLTELSVDANAVIWNLECQNNLIEKLDFSNNPKLWYGSCSGNKLTAYPPFNLEEGKSPSIYFTGQHSTLELDISDGNYVADFSKLMPPSDFANVHFNFISSDYNPETGKLIYKSEKAPTTLSYFVDSPGNLNGMRMDVTLDLTAASPLPPKISGAYLTLEDNLKINYVVKKEAFHAAGYVNPYIIFSLNGAETRVSDFTETDDSYVFSFANIAPNKMNDTIYATLYASLNGETAAGKTVEYSIAEYCCNTLEKYSPADYPAERELRRLIVDLLKYGAKSQLYTNHNTESLVTDALTETQLSWGTYGDPANIMSVLDREYAKVENPLAVWKGAGLNLTDTIEVYLVLETDDINGLEVKIEGSDFQTAIIPSSKFTAENGRYLVTFNGLNAGQLASDIYATVCKDGTAVSNTVRYSVESYAAAKLNDADARLVELVKAMVNYGRASYNYIH